MKVREALRAICSAGKGHCWHCDERLPVADEAIRTGWDVQRTQIEGERAASIILVCPDCLRQKGGARRGNLSARRLGTLCRHVSTKGLR